MNNSTSETAAPGSGTAPSRRPIGRILAGVGLLVALVVIGREAGAYVPRFAEWVDGLGVWGPVVFIAGYAIAVVGFVPGSVLTLAGGAIFGILKGTIYVAIAATIGATAAFIVSRNFARSAIERKLRGDKRFAAIDEAVGSQGRRIVFLLRLSPVFPFNLLNYALGLTKVRLGDYVVASVGMIPGTLLYVYYGKLAGDVAALAGGVASERGPADYALLAVGLVATILVTLFVTRLAKKALSQAAGE